MLNVEGNARILPTGRWLAQERERLSLTLGQVARALRRHPSTVRAVERNNHVIPPGWGDDLSVLGMPLPAPAWPSHMPVYRGSDLERDMNTRAGLQHSRYWLSKQLGVPEALVTTVIRGNMPVPHHWLLKLAELGANVPTSVRAALYRPTRDAPDPVPPAAEPAKDFTTIMAELARESLRSSMREDEEPDASSVTSEESERPSEGRNAAQPSDAQPNLERRKQQSIYFHWTEENGLHFSVSAPLLEQIPAVMKGILLALCEGGLLKPAQSPKSPGAAERSHG